MRVSLEIAPQKLGFWRCAGVPKLLRRYLNVPFEYVFISPLFFIYNLFALPIDNRSSLIIVLSLFGILFQRVLAIKMKTFVFGCSASLFN